MANDDIENTLRLINKRYNLTLRDLKELIDKLAYSEEAPLYAAEIKRAFEKAAAAAKMASALVMMIEFDRGE